MTISMDLDGTVFDTAPALVHLWDVERFPVPDLTQYDLGSRDGIRHALQRLEQARGYALLRPIAGSVESIKRLAGQGHTIHFITSRPMHPDVWTDTVSSLRDNGLDSIGDLWLCGRHSKVDVMMDLRCQVAFDDRPQVAMEAAAAGIRTILISQPWNSKVRGRVKRTSWSLFLASGCTI